MVCTLSRLRALALALPLALATACSADDLDGNGKPTVEATGDQDPLGKADALRGRSGPLVANDNSDTQVWRVRNRWDDTETAAAREAGIAWPANSGMSWSDKYHAWVSSLEKEGQSFRLTTPFGKTIGAPALECAEVAMFLRIAFASWYELPFYIEAFADGERVFFGHMGIVTRDGRRWNRMPRFKNSYPDFSSMADQVRADPSAWPSDARLREKSIIGQSGDSQPAVGGANAGAFFDEIFLNKRVGQFLVRQLGFNGSIHLASASNTYNLRADAFEPGDFLVERFGPTGIGHTIVVKKVTETGDEILFESERYKTREAEVMSGTMPRRQPLWEGPSAAKSFYFTNGFFGGEQTVDHGAGLRRFRSPRAIGGRWSNSVLPAESETFVNGNSRAKLVRRQQIYEQILVQRTPEERMAETIDNIEFQRQHLRLFPSSCAARGRREKAFDELYSIGEELMRSRDSIDREFRSLEDYVFAELVYEQSKTCCWNSSNSEMYEAAMLYNQCLLGEIDDPACAALEAAGACTDVRVFHAHAGDGDGFDTFRRFAVANGFNFVPWSADESCPQAGVSADTLDPEQPTDLCEIADDIR